MCALQVLGATGVRRVREIAFHRDKWCSCGVVEVPLTLTWDDAGGVAHHAVARPFFVAQDDAE